MITFQCHEDENSRDYHAIDLDKNDVESLEETDGPFGHLAATRVRMKSGAEHLLAQRINQDPHVRDWYGPGNPL